MKIGDITLTLGALEYYLITINVVGFILFLINTYLYDHTADKSVDIPLTIVAIAGGSAGIVLAILLTGQNAEKENMMSRVFVLAILVIQIIVVLFLKGFHREQLTFAFINFFEQHRLLVYYLVIINFISVIAYGVDKINAFTGRSRIRIVTLLGLAFAGGSVGALLAMYFFRHKTKKDYFSVGIPLIIIMQVVVIFYVMNMR